MTSREQDAVRLLLLIDGACEPVSDVDYVGLWLVTRWDDVMYVV